MTDTDHPAEAQAPATPAPAPTAGTLSKDQQDRAQAWLRAHWTGLNCPFHPGPTKWQIGDVIVAPIGLSGTTFVLGLGPIIPLFVVTCMNCGHTVFINALVSGIISRPQETHQSEEGQG